MGAVSRLEGMKQARETLQTLSTTVQRNVGKRALKAGPGRIFVEAVRSRAKVSERSRDPTRGSLKAAPKVADERSRKGTAATVAVIVDDPAAVPKELGLVRRDYPAEPFFRPAIDSALVEAGAAMAEEVKREIDAAAIRAAKRSKG